MECGICKEAYNNSESIPLSCKCGTTQCRKCIRKLSENDTFNCLVCKKSTKIKDLTINRAMEDIILAIKKINQNKAKIPKVKKILIDKSQRNTDSSVDNKQIDSSTIICFNQATEAFVEFDSHKVQTARSLVSIEKIKLKVLSVKIVWKKCFLIPIYFLFQSPWVFLAVFGYEKGQEENLTWIGVWLLNFSFFCYFYVLNSGSIDDYQATKAKNWKARCLILSVLFETFIIWYGWYMYLKVATGSFLHKDQLNSALGATLTGTFFNSFMLVLIVFILVSGHPLVHTPRKLDTKKFTYNKSISLKFLVFIVLFIIPDLLMVSSKTEVLANK